MPERVSAPGGQWSTFRLIVMVRLAGALAIVSFGLSHRAFNKFVFRNVVAFQPHSRAAPQTVQTASPVCGTKNFSSVRLYSAPQLHCTIVAIPTSMRFGLSIFQPGLTRFATSRSRPTFADPSHSRGHFRKSMPASARSALPP
jgi:hypothetical protein